ncbi:MAG: hypothetical protein IJC98_02405 [Clostridia bacterium]|nr:hypothetical protein [Clostridia bacterium]
MKKQWIWLCVLLMCAQSAVSLTACGRVGGSQNGTDTEKQNGTGADTADQTNAAEHYRADLPQDLDYNAAPFNIVVYDHSNSTWYDVDFSATGIDGTTINDAAYRRMHAVEQMLNVDIVAKPSAGYGFSAIHQSVRADEGDYHVGFVCTRSAINLAESGFLWDLNEIETLDIDAPWWDQNAARDLTVGERLYMMTGDISIMYKKSIGVLLFNKQLIEDNHLEDPYQLVKDHKWTIDKFNEMAASVSKDLNGDSQYDLDDRYGLLYYCDMIAMGMIGAGTQFTVKDDQDYPVLTFYNDRTQTIFDKYIDVMYDPQQSVSWSRLGKTNDEIIAMFQAGQGLFNYNEFHAIENMRRSDLNFGILPMPLYDESQKDYHHIINPHVAAMLLVPKDCPDVDMTGYVLDALGAESKNVLTPAYYDQYLKSKGTRDNESAAMLDLIFDTMTYDIGYLYDFGGLPGMLLNMVNQYDKDLASNYEAYESMATEAIRSMIAAYQSHEH